jgi:hypothetical protein
VFLEAQQHREVRGHEQHGKASRDDHAAEDGEAERDARIRVGTGMTANPPLLRPSRLFLGASTVLMGAHDGAVDHGVLIVRVSPQILEHPLPHAVLGPAREAGMDLDRIAKALRQIAPRDARSVALQHGFHEQPVVPGRHPRHGPHGPAADL